MSLETWENLWESETDTEWDDLSEEIYCTLKRECSGFGGRKILEAGSGSGRVSLKMSMEGARITLLDYSQNALELGRSIFERQKQDVRIVKHDLRNPLPFKDGEFDIVWNSGVMEHFTQRQRVDITREIARIAGQFHTFNPYSNSFFYRLGKWAAEKNGTWRYGEEYPVKTMSSIFDKCPMKLESEYTVAHINSLDFLDLLPEYYGVKYVILTFLDSLSVQERKEMLKSLGGYLLYSKGVKQK